MPTLPRRRSAARGPSDTTSLPQRPRLGGDLTGASTYEDTLEDGGEPAAAEPQLQNQWSTGTGLATKGVTALIAGCLVCAPVALGWQAFGPKPQPQQVAAQTGVDPNKVSRRVVAGDTAARWVHAWLTTTAADQETLQAIYPKPVALPEEASKATGVRVAEAVATGPDLWFVTVSARVTPPGGTESSRMYGVPVQVAGKAGNVAATPVSPPAPVPAPKGVDLVTANGYGHSATTKGSLGTTVTAFMQALLTDEGDLTRVITPGSTLRPVGGYARVEVENISLAEDVTGARDSQVPKDGTTAKALVTVELFEPGTPKNTREGLEASYPLLLTARGNRWEVTSLDAALTSLEGIDSSRTTTQTKE